MSLVREALAKAEREAAARAAREHGLPAALADAQSFRARRRRRWPWALGLAAAALAGAAATAVLSGAWRGEPAPAPPAASLRAAVETAPVATPSALPETSAVPPPREASAAVASRAPAVHPPVAPAVERPAGYVRELALAGGRSIRLGGIAWSASAPLAYLNGRLVGVGESVEGHRVTRIDRDRVTLDDGARRIVLALR